MHLVRAMMVKFRLMICKKHNDEKYTLAELFAVDFEECGSDRKHWKRWFLVTHKVWFRYLRFCHRRINCADDNFKRSSS